jgi:hypothetical protein
MPGISESHERTRSHSFEIERVPHRFEWEFQEMFTRVFAGEPVAGQRVQRVVDVVLVHPTPERLELSIGQLEDKPFHRRIERK